MTGRFIIRTIGLALLALALGVLIVIIWVTIYSEVIDTGRGQAFYEAYANRIAPIIGIVSGIPLLFGAGWITARQRHPGAGWQAGAAVGIAYAVIDMPLVAALAGGAIPWSYVVLSYASKIAAAAAGGWVAARRALANG